jgi:hypothetical protein
MVLSASNDGLPSKGRMSMTLPPVDLDERPWRGELDKKSSIKKDLPLDSDIIKIESRLGDSNNDVLDEIDQLTNLMEKESVWD